MEKTTFADPAVKTAMSNFSELKFRAEDLSDPHVKDVLDYYGIPGLPVYIILEPVSLSAP